MRKPMPARQHIASVTSKGQVTIPIVVRKLLGIAPHDKVAFVVEADQVRLALATSVVARTAGVLRSEQPALSPEAEQAAAEDTMALEADRKKTSQ